MSTATANSCKTKNGYCKKSQGKKCVAIVHCALKRYLEEIQVFLNNMTVLCAKVCDKHSVDWIQTNSIDKRIFEIFHCIYRQKISFWISLCEWQILGDKTTLTKHYGLVTKTKGNRGEKTKNRRNVSQ